MLEPSERFANALAMREAIQAQFKLLGIEDPRADLEAYFRDPPSYEAAQTEKLLLKLQEMGAEARKHGDVQGAANAYNRALAYAPNDTNLLRVVATLARAEDRRRMLRRSATPVMAILALGLSAFGVTKLVTAQRAEKDPVTRPRTDVSAVQGPVTTAPSSVSAPPKASVTTKPPRFTAAASASAPRKEPRLRTINITATEPPVGVLCAIDKETPQPVNPGQPISLSEGPHDFVFTCVGDMCIPQPTHVEASDKDGNMSVRMKIKDARIVVDGPVSGTYGVSQLPDVVLHPGVPVPVPMRAGSDTFTVIERGSGKSVTISARAGQEAHAAFPDLGP
jgi:hypothetical protein